MYQLSKTLFDKLDSFGIPYTDKQELFNNTEKFWFYDFESICGGNENLKHSQTTLWIGKHILILVSTLSNLMHEPIFLRNLNPRDFVSSFIDPLEVSAPQSKVQRKKNFLRIETAKKLKCPYPGNIK